MKKTFAELCELAWPWLLGLLLIPIAVLVLGLCALMLNGLLLMPIVAWLVIYPIYCLMYYLRKRNKKKSKPNSPIINN